MGLMPVAKYLKDRIQGGSEVIEARAHEALRRFLTGVDPKARLLETHIPWNTEREIAVMIEMRKDGDEWEVGRSPVRVQFVRSFRTIQVKKGFTCLGRCRKRTYIFERSQ